MNCSLQELADRMELSETRKNSTVARRYIVALPHEVSKEERAELALGFLEHLNKEYGVAGAVTVHEPDKGGDQRNYHAHITISDRAVTPEGEFGSKVRVLTSMKTRNVELEKIKEHWEERCNQILESKGKEKVAEKSIVPGVHLGKQATEIIRKGDSYKIEAEDWNNECKSLDKEYKIYGAPDETYEEKVKRLIGDVKICPREKAQWEAEQKGGEFKNEKDYDSKGIIRDNEADRTFPESKTDQAPMGGTQRHDLFPRSGSEQSGEGAKSSGSPRIAERKSETDREEESRPGSRKLESLLREVKRRARKLDQRKDEDQREREARGYPHPRRSLDTIGKLSLRDSMDDNKRKVLDAFKSIMPRDLKYKLNYGHLKDLFKDYKQTIQKVVEKTVSRKHSRAYEDEGR